MAPASKASSACVSYEVMKTMWQPAPMRRATSSPDSSGIWMSRNTRSGACSSIACSAATPSVARATICSCGHSVCSRSASSSASSGSSSASTAVGAWRRASALSWGTHSVRRAPPPDVPTARPAAAPSISLQQRLRAGHRGLGGPGRQASTMRHTPSAQRACSAQSPPRERSASSTSGSSAPGGKRACMAASDTSSAMPQLASCASDSSCT
jgi:hypothetical protein